MKSTSIFLLTTLRGGGNCPDCPPGYATGRAGSSTRYVTHVTCRLATRGPASSWWLTIYVITTHHVIRNFEKRKAAKFVKNVRGSYRNVDVIASTLEKFISFDINRLRFTDTYQFMSASLEKLGNNLPIDSLRHTRKHLGDDELLYAKGIFPYEWFESMGKLNCV
jgi:hypothetical protein